MLALEREVEAQTLLLSLAAEGAERRESSAETPHSSSPAAAAAGGRAADRIPTRRLLRLPGTGELEATRVLGEATSFQVSVPTAAAARQIPRPGVGAPVKEVSKT